MPLVAVATAIGIPSGASADQWYKTDLHVHSSFSGDATDDIGIIADAAKQRGYDAIFLTDHTATSNAEIGGVVANDVHFDDDGFKDFSAASFGTLTSFTDATNTTEHNTGVNSLELSSTTGSGAYGEHMRWYKRGAQLRSGDTFLTFAVKPTRIDPGTGLYVSVSIGGDTTITSRPPQGYTTTDNVAHPGKSNVFVWQIGNPRTPSNTPDQRVTTHQLSYTLGQWNTYTINLSQAVRDEIPAAEQPLDYNAFTQLKLASGGQGGTASGFFDTYNVKASGGHPSGEEFVYRNGRIHDFDTPNFTIFPSQEVGWNRHAMNFNFPITDQSQYVLFKQGYASIPSTQAAGYPAQLNHPGLPGGVTQQEAIDNLSYGSDLMETAERSDEEGYIKNVMVDTWDQILKQGRVLMGSWTSDMHRVERLAPATYVKSPNRSFNALMQNIFEGRTYLANFDFPGRGVFNVDGGSEPYAARYPTYVSPSQTLANVHFKVDAGITPGSRILWTSNGSVIATDRVDGPSFDVTKTIPLGGPFTYVRAEVRNPAGVRMVMSQPIFFNDAPGLLPSGMTYNVTGVTTPTGTNYTRVATQGVTSQSWDATARKLSLGLTNPSGSLDAMQVTTGGQDPSALTVDGASVPAAASRAAFDAATGSSWWFDPAARILLLKAKQSGGTATAEVTFTGGADTTAPVAPQSLTAHAHGAERVDLAWQPSTSPDTSGYTLYRDGTAVALLGPGQTSFTDTQLAAGTHFTYTVDAFDPSGNHSPLSNSASTTTATVTVQMYQPTIDSYVDAGNPNTNFGTAQTIRLDGDPLLRGYLRFDLSGLSGTIEKATLRLYNNSKSSGYDVHATTNAWTETGIRSSNAPAPGDTLFGSSNGGAVGAWSEADITPLISGNGSYDIALDAVTPSAVSFSSRQGPNPPQLVIETSVPSNDPPQASDRTINTGPGVPANWTPLVNDSDGDTLTCAIVSQPAHGTATVANDCSTGTYTPNAGFTGSDPFTYKATDPSNADSNVANVSVTVAGSNNAPTAADRSLTTDEDTAGNWTPSVADADSDPTTCQIVSQPAHGTATVANDCSTGTYTPNANFNGSDPFTYRSTDSHSAQSSAATVSVTVNPVNDAPSAADRTLAIDEDTSAGPWTPLVTDPDSGDSPTCTIVSQPAHGSATIASDCSGGTYTPNGNYNGSDSLTYSATDSHGVGSNTATLSITVNSVNDAPQAANRTVNTSTGLTTAWTPSVSDTEGDALTCSIVTAPAHGTATVAPDCASGTYTSAAGYSGADPFTYRATDSNGGQSNAATVDVTVIGAATTVTTFTAAADSYVDASLPNNNYGTATTLRIDGSPLIRTYLRFDLSGLSGTVTKATLRLTNNSASAGYDVHSVGDNSWTEAGIKASNAPPAGATLYGHSSGGAAGATSQADITSLISGNGNGSYSMTLDALNSSAISFSSRQGASPPQLIVETSTPSNAPPSASDRSLTTDEDTPGSWTPSVSDANSDPVTCEIVSQPSHGSATVSSDCSTGGYTPTGNYNGPDSFTYRATDSHSALSNTATVSATVNPVNDAPSAADRSLTTAEDTAGSWTPSVADVDSGDPATCAIVSQPAHGSASVASDCSSGTYTPSGDYNGSDSFTYRATDSHSAQSGAATVSATITAVNDAPSAADRSLTTAEDTSGSWTPSVVDADSGDSASCAIVSQPAHGSATVASDCSGGTYTPNGNYNGSDSFTYRATDSQSAQSGAATVSATVTAVNDAPTAADRSLTTNQDTAGSWTPSVADIDGDSPTCSIVGSPAHGSATVASNCSGGTYTPAAGYSGPDSFTYRSSDGSGAQSAPATVSATVTQTSLFSDGFETGNLSAWTSSSGLTVQSATVKTGSFAARGQTAGGVTWAKRTLPSTYSDVTYRLAFRAAAAPAGSPTIMKLRSGTDKAMDGLFLTPAMKLALRNDVNSTSKTSATTLQTGRWYQLELHTIVNGAASTVEVRVDGTLIADLSSTTNDLGTAPIGVLQLGENVAGKTYDFQYDDVVAQRGSVGSGKVAALGRAPRCSAASRLRLGGSRRQAIARTGTVQVLATSLTDCQVTAVAMAHSGKGGKGPIVKSRPRTAALPGGDEGSIVLRFSEGNRKRIKRALVRRPVYVLVYALKRPTGAAALARRRVVVRP
ncbi:MAG: large repetitive protein [Thermoleophilaceae bacterium]|nr:large repetitive protein [Thermoleophilaceae bacterium]